MPTSFEVDGERYRLRFTSNALAELEERTGLALTKLGEQMQAGNLGIKDVRYLMWAGLLHQDPEIELNDAGDMMDELGIVKCVEVITSAFADAFPTAEEAAQIGSPGKKSKTAPAIAGTSS